MEEQGDILQLQSLGLGIEKVHHRNEDGIQHGENDEGAPADIVYTYQYRSSACQVENLPNAIGVIFTTANTAIQFHPDAMACILVRTRVVFSSAG